MIADGNFLNETYEKAQAGLRMLRSEITRKGLKEFRVAIKRLRAFAMLIDYIEVQTEISKSRRNDFTSQLKAYKSVFRASGGLRDTELSIKFLVKYETELNIQCPEYKSELLSRSEEQNREFREAFASMKRLSYLQLILRIINELRDLEAFMLFDQTSKWLDQQEAEYLHLLNNISSEEDIHEIRKILKQMYFIGELTDVPVPNEDEGLKKRLRHIGKWHDRTIFRDNMNAWLQTFDKGKILNFSAYEMLLTQIELEARAQLAMANINFYEELP